MKFPIVPLALLLILIGCGDRRTAPPLQAEHHDEGEQINPSLHVPISPQFSVDVQLSKAATKKLIDGNETIIIAAYFTGHPKQGTEPRYLDIKSGDIDLGDARQEIHPGETAKFSGLNLNTDALAQIDSQGPHILMSVFSGRKSMKDNLLHCDDYAGSFESIRGRTIVIRCRLIEEPFPRPGN